MAKKHSDLKLFEAELKSVVKFLQELDPADLRGSPHEEQADDEESQYKVIHLKNNPFQESIRAKELEFDRLQEENAKLRARVSLLESRANADSSSRNFQLNYGDRSSQIERLSRKVAELEERERNSLSSFQKLSREFREVCYLLTGYRVDVLKNHTYRLSNMYAEREEDVLLFEIITEMVQLLQTPFSDQLRELIRTYLEDSDSFPAFLAAVTLELFKSTTQLAQMSVCMSTTNQPETTKMLP